MSNLQPNCCLEFDFQKVDQHAGGKWLIHDTKRRKDNQLQSLKLPCRISKLSSKMWHKGARWHRVCSHISSNSFNIAQMFIISLFVVVYVESNHFLTKNLIRILNFGSKDSWPPYA